MNATARNIKTLGSNTEGEGSERYQLVKKMVETGALNGSQHSLCKSGLLIGSKTAGKYHAALIRDGVVAARKNESVRMSDCEIYLDERLGVNRISENKSLGDFTQFLIAARDGNIGKDYAYLKQRHKDILNLANFSLILEVVSAFRFFHSQTEESWGNVYKNGIEIIKKGDLK